MAKIETFIDDFSTLDTTNNWDIVDDTPSIVSGQLNLKALVAGNGRSAVSSKNTYDLTGSYAVIQLISSTDSYHFGTSGFLTIKDSSGNTICWSYDEGNTTLAGLTSNFDSPGGTIPTYTPGMYVRIRELSGTLYWDYSYDGLTWVNAGTVAVSGLFTSITALSVELIAYAHGSDATVILDNLNILPTPPSANTNTFFRMF